jgi:hypothetical protein
MGDIGQGQLQVVLDELDHVHVSSSKIDTDAVRTALDAGREPGFWTHTPDGVSSTVCNGNRRKLVKLFRLTIETLRNSGFVVVNVDQSARGPNATIWEQDDLTMVVVTGLATVEALKAASGVFQMGLIDAGLATPTSLGHPEPSVAGIVGHCLHGAYEPGVNTSLLVDFFREQRWRVEHRSSPPGG